MKTITKERRAKKIAALRAKIEIARGLLHNAIGISRDCIDAIVTSSMDEGYFDQRSCFIEYENDGRHNPFYSSANKAQNKVSRFSQRLDTAETRIRELALRIGNYKAEIERLKTLPTRK